MPYLEGLSRLGLTSADGCVAFEDSRTGLQSSTAAKLTSVGIMSSLTRDELVESGAAIAVERYDAPTLSALLNRA
jgi:phosphoglycolate phosphatase